jgi:hypothetical protein
MENGQETAGARRQQWGDRKAGENLIRPFPTRSEPSRQNRKRAVGAQGWYTRERIAGSSLLVNIFIRYHSNEPWKRVRTEPLLKSRRSELLKFALQDEFRRGATKVEGRSKMARQAHRYKGARHGRRPLHVPRLQTVAGSSWPVRWLIVQIRTEIDFVCARLGWTRRRRSGRKGKRRSIARRRNG